MVVEWGNVFLPASLARRERGEILAGAAHRAAVIQDQFGDLTDDVLERNLLYQLLLKYRPDAVVDSINTATAFAYQDIFQSARDLLAASAAGTLDQAQVERHIRRAHHAPGSSATCRSSPRRSSGPGPPRM